jgi:Pyruvate/2-oxoacid:ferredoxin oxidoreductase gamma subunit
VSLGDARLANTVMLGAASAWLPLDSEALLAQVLERFTGKEALRQRNAAAFEAGRALTQEVAAA